jgi:hypothetical protein
VARVTRRAVFKTICQHCRSEIEYSYTDVQVKTFSSMGENETGPHVQCPLCQWWVEHDLDNEVK